ncbi:purine catabolism regulatory protein [Amphibacillus marinus]|uniref:Purine catabolism regulatory protein n=1 Tax=Amphibacillus marinus TaxID=872970 RepID=A0A1H8H134_9BACI|nr:PucR family transcriptional regulator [Amphibacillus marinus]SEN49719.1 purine catabolism regulatory protein [Amphibacillus marinus]
MSVTIESVLNMEAFSDVAIIAGQKGINRQIQNVYVMEVPDIFSYVDQHGLLFTTLYPIANNNEAMMSFIPELAKQQLAGVAIKLGRYISEVPKYMIEQAEARDFPILVLPNDANLSLLTNHILTALLGMKTSMLEFRETISQQLHALLLQGADLVTFVHYVSQITGGNIVILDNSLNCTASSFDIQDDEFTVDREQFQQWFNSSNITENNPSIIKVNQTTYGKAELFIQSIAAGTKRLGYLVVLIDEPGKMTKHLNVVVEQAIILLAFLLQTEQTIIQKERNYLDNFIRDIMNDRYQSQAEIIEKAKVFRWNFNFPNIILLIKSQKKDSSKRLSTYYKILDSGKIPRIIAGVFDVPIQNCKVIHYNGELMCLISVAFETRLQQRLKTAGERLIARLADYGQLGIGISEVIYQVHQLKTAYDHALLVHRVNDQQGTSESYVQFYDDLGLYKLFYLINDHALLNEFIDEKIGEVIHYDQQRDINLLETLTYLIKNNGNLQKTADEMFIHYNSLRYRVNKLKELGLELDEGHKFTEIAVACQLFQYLNN